MIFHMCKDKAGNADQEASMGNTAQLAEALILAMHGSNDQPGDPAAFGLAAGLAMAYAIAFNGLPDTWPDFVDPNELAKEGIRLLEEHIAAAEGTTEQAVKINLN